MCWLAASAAAAVLVAALFVPVAGCNITVPPWINPVDTNAPPAVVTNNLPARTLLGGPHVFFGPAVIHALRLDPEAAMKAMADNGLSFKFDLFGTTDYDMDTIVTRYIVMLKAAERHHVMGCLTLSNGGDLYWDRADAVAYLKPFTDRVLAAANKDMVIVEPVAESSVNKPRQIQYEDYVFQEWHVKRGGAMSWNRSSRPLSLPAGYDVLDYHVLSFDGRKAIPAGIQRAIVSADTTPMVFWLTGKSEYGKQYVPATVYQMVHTCLTEKYWGVDVYPYNFDQMDAASMAEAGRALREFLK
jgi:hypothetical protein